MTMDCLQFRRIAGADPQQLDAAARSHAAACPGCAEELRQLLALDARILAALEVPVPAPGVVAVGGTAPIVRLDRRRWLALAASIAGGVMIGTLLWVGGPSNSLARDLVEHLGHEPEALLVTQRPEDESVLGEVLQRGGIRLRPEVGTVSYANTCIFRGRRVPHLVVQTDGGPVTVMVLRHERPAGPERFDEQGFVGRIVPAGPGSIALIGTAADELDQVTADVMAAVEWL
jgi:hypothetical protein